ncbi:pentapeptide repeat-containing protein [Halomicrobium salinisoli]|uniref:pentapeptide repeat-containing protein n=1 Tax=Halomicrobium salinisoli TaxID=2878391 RepID=UPI001CF03B28|nr:pentapeptide repeat-containing protein [Halomicrobium salinisoli]
MLRGLDLRDVDWLSETVLIGANLANADVSRADLSDVDLRNSNCKDMVASETNFQRANLERANFREADLRGADLRETRFDGATLSDSRISSQTDLGERVIYETEMRGYSDPHKRENALETAIRVYGRLEDLSQDNSLNAQASQYYRKSKDVRRRYNWQERNYASGIVAEASRMFTGYGNRPGRVMLTSMFVILVTALLYPLVGGLERTSGTPAIFGPIDNVTNITVGQYGVTFARSVYFSVVTFTTLGYGNLEPKTRMGHYIAGMEALVGTILLALFVGVLTRSTWLR